MCIRDRPRPDTGIARQLAVGANATIGVDFARQGPKSLNRRLCRAKHQRVNGLHRVIGQRPKPRARIGIVNQPLVNTAAGYAFDVQEILLASHGPNVKNPHESTGAVALVVSSDFGTAGYETDTKTAIARLNRCV